MTTKRLATVRQVAEMMGRSDMTIYRMISDGRLPGIIRTSPKSILIDLDKVEEWLEKGGIDNDQQ